MPLHLLVPALRRINPPSSSVAQPHPMHAFLEPLLLTPRNISNKYHTELPQIPADGGGAGEMEETVVRRHSRKTKRRGMISFCLRMQMDRAWVRNGRMRIWKGWRGASVFSFISFHLFFKDDVNLQIQILLLTHKLSLPGPLHFPPGREKRRRIDVEMNRILQRKITSNPTWISCRLGSS